MKVASPSEEEIRVNEEVKRTIEQDKTGVGRINDYAAEKRAKVGQYAADQKPARGVRHFSRTLYSRNNSEKVEVRIIESGWSIWITLLIFFLATENRQINIHQFRFLTFFK